MRHLIESITEKKLSLAKEHFSESIKNVALVKLEEMKKMIMAKEQFRAAYDGGPGARREKLKRDVIEEDEIEEAVDPKEDSMSVERGTPQPPKNTTVVPKNNMGGPGSTHYKNMKEEETEEQLDEARFKIVKARVRGGKIQRRKKVATQPGFTYRGGKLTRMSPVERRRRKLGAKRGKIKRRSKMARALQKRKRSLMKRRTIGL